MDNRKCNSVFVEHLSRCNISDQNEQTDLFLKISKTLFFWTHYTHRINPISFTAPILYWRWQIEIVLRIQAHTRTQKRRNTDLKTDIYAKTVVVYRRQQQKQQQYETFNDVFAVEVQGQFLTIKITEFTK